MRSIPTPRTLSQLPLSFNWFDARRPGKVDVDPGPLGNIKKRIGKTCQLTTRSIGGWWTLTAHWDPRVNEDLRPEQTADPATIEKELREVFITGLMRELVVSLGGSKVFVGFLSKMIMTLASGEQYSRDWAKIWNKVKAIYTRIGDNELTNGSAETSAWADYNTPSTNAQSTDWRIDGDYSNHTVADSVNDGATIQTGIVIVANKAYDSQVSVYIVSGTWVFEVYRTDTGAALASQTEDGVGEFILTADISDQNSYAGTVGVRIYCTAASGEIYADAAIFQDAPIPSETEWYEDTVSQGEFGTKEFVILLGGSAPAAARARAQTQLRKMAWPRSIPPERHIPRYGSMGPKLELFFSGYVMTLSNTHAMVMGTDDMSDQVDGIIGEAEFVDPGVIDENTVDYQIENQGPVKLWHILQEIAMDGDSSGNRWECGVYQDRKFNYNRVEETPLYRWRGNQLFLIDNTPVDPWLVRPGYVILDDMPLGIEAVSGYETDEPRIVYMSEVTFDAAEWLTGKSGISWSQTHNDE